MSRIRTIKPEFFLNDELAELSPLHRLLFVGLWTLADREGRLEDRPKRIKAQLLPYDDCDAEQLLAELDAERFIQRYEADSKGYIAIVNFSKHQRISGSEAESSSQIPPPPEKGSTEEAPEKTEENLGSTEEAPGTTGKERKGKERKGKEYSCAEPPQADDSTPHTDQVTPVHNAAIGPEEDAPRTHGSAKDADGVFITLPLNTGKEHPITAEQVAEWFRLYPAVDVHQELRNMRGWLIANPNRRKTRKGVDRFINGWLSREQDKGPPPNAPRASPQRQSKQQSLENRNQAAVDEWLNSCGRIIEGETDNVRH